MSKIKFQGNASGTGVLTITSPNTNDDRTITLPDGTGTLIADDGSGNVVLEGGDTLLVNETDSTNKAVRIASDVNEGFVQLYKDGSQTVQIRGDGTSYFNNGNVLIGADSGDAFNSDSMLRLQRTGDRVFMQFKTDADQESGILFGDVDDDVECAIEYEPANKALTFSTGNNAEAMRILSSGGITFNGDTATANALEDYEEGTYAYTITGATSGSMTPRSGYNHFAYTKIGRLVTVQGRWETSGSHTASGQLRFSLPFSAHDGQSQSAQGAGVMSVYRAGANFNNARAVVFNNSNYFVIYYNEGGTGDSDATVQGGDIDATSEGSLSLTYMT